MSSSERGLVLTSYGNEGIIELEDGTILSCKYRRQVGRPFCGDYVQIQRMDNDSGVVKAIESRRNSFIRADQQQRQHVVATNLDQVVVVIAPKPQPTRDILERYLVAISSLDIKPVIVVNKAEWLDQEARETHPLDKLDEYQQLGYMVLYSSCKTEPGIGELQKHLQDRTSILVGQSGVGKSSLVNRLIPDRDIQTGALSTATGKGTHTTTTTSLYHLPEGGSLIDSPGVWEYGIWKLDEADLGNGFTEFREWIGHCRFNNCLHKSEPGCAIKQAVEENCIKDWRYQAYLRLLEQNQR